MRHEGVLSLSSRRSQFAKASLNIKSVLVSPHVLLNGIVDNVPFCVLVDERVMDPGEDEELQFGQEVSLWSQHRRRLVGVHLETGLRNNRRIQLNILDGIDVVWQALATEEEVS